MTERVVSYGHLTTKRALLAKGGLLIGGGVAWLASFLLLPGVVLVLVAFLQRDPDGGITWAFSLDSFRQLFGITSSGLSAANLWIMLRSVALAVFTTHARVAPARSGEQVHVSPCGMQRRSAPTCEHVYPAGQQPCWPTIPVHPS